jgi:hypothetical protein
MKLDALKVKELANEVELALHNYHEAIFKDPLINEKINKLINEKDILIERMDKNKLKEYSLEINTVEYWSEIAISKIRIIEIIGGLHLLKEVNRYITDMYRPIYDSFTNEI